MKNTMFRSWHRTAAQTWRRKEGGKRINKGVLATAGAAAFAWGWVSTSSEKEEDARDDGVTSYSWTAHGGQDSYRNTTSNLLAMSPSPTSMDESASAPTTAPKEIKTLKYDFVVVGHGNAGRSAVATLQTRCPKAKIAVVDPLRPFSTSKAKNVFYWPQRALSFYPQTNTVLLANGTELQYRHAILVATGSRGSPPPEHLFDQGALDRIIELRPTEAIEHRTRPVLPPQTVRQLALMASAEGARVAILGSGWDAVELAVATARSGGTPMLTFGSPGPLSHVLPRYLSTAVMRRLRQHGIDIKERSLVRYVATDDRSSSIPRLEVHTAKSYDLIDTQRTLVDLLVVAPYVDGPRGTACLPTATVPRHLEEANEGRPWYQTWSQLTSSSPGDPSMVVCYADDGRIVVNAELNAASHVYAAGSVAKYPSSQTGHAHVAGEGGVDGALAGRVAALHMSRDYHERMSGNPTRHRNDKEASSISFAAESFPMWRSDVCSYLPGEEAETASLAAVGIRALCVGQCDSERMATHGFWWTNQAVQRRLTRRQTQAEDTGSTSQHRPRRRRTNRTASANRPVYGTGVVFYLDRTGRIRGIMTWGLPFTRSEDGETILDQDLVGKMKAIIHSDGGISQWEAEDDGLLKSAHLAEESRNIVSLAVSRSPSTTSTNDGLVDPIAKPLHRYTPAKPPSMTSVGMLRRRDQTGCGELLGENLYVRNEHDMNAPDRPQSLVYVYPMNDGSTTLSADGALQSRRSVIREERIRRALQDNELRARPPKEEPLWLRRGEAHRMINMRQAMAEKAQANMLSGRFSDGSDPVKQAPVPEVVLRARESMRNLGSTGGNIDDMETRQQDVEYPDAESEDDER